MPFQLELELKGVRLRGHDHFWDAIRALGIGGCFTILDIEGRGTAHEDSVRDFVLRLSRAGIVEPDGWREVRNPAWKPGSSTRARVYRVLQTPRDTPMLTRDGRPGTYGVARQHMWAIIRGPQVREGFDARDLVVLAETDEVSIALGSAKEYVQKLARAGYLACVQPAANNRLARYRLRLSMNTGPKAPKLLKTSLVYDPNKRAVFGEATAEEVRP